MEGFCRGCLVKYDEPFELLPCTETNRRLFVYSTGIQIKDSDAATFQLCKSCNFSIKSCSKFKKQCRTSNKKYKHYLALKEVGDTYDLGTFLKKNDDFLKISSFSASSTPANKSQDEDNESTCTSIRNFMTDILQGEEVPDNEARLIKEVIQEEIDVLDDTLESHWLLDDNCADNYSRLDISFSPFSTPRSINNECYTPNKKSNISFYNIVPNTIIEEYNTVEKNIADNKENINTSVETQDKIHQFNDHDAKNETEDMSVDTNDEYYNMQHENALAVKHIKVYVDNDIPESNIVYKIEPINLDNDKIAVKKNEIDDNEQNSKNSYENKYVADSQPGKRLNIVYKNDSIDNQDDMSTKTGLNFNIQLVVDKEPRCSDSSDQVFDKETGKQLTLDVLMGSPSAYPAGTGALTPMVNDILFGQNLEEKSIESTAKESPDKESIEEDILDKLLEKGVEELDVDTQDTFTNNTKYDLEKCVCRTCNKTFQSVKSIKIHLSKIHQIKLPHNKSRDFDKKTRICQICGATYNDYGNFMRHVKRHDKSEVKCKVCSVMFTSIQKLKVHMESHEVVLQRNTDDEISKEKTTNYFCYTCGMQLCTKAGYYLHMKRHKREYTCKCSECEKSFYRKSDLQVHMRVHTGEQPFSCEVCQKRFRVKNGLIKHMKVHLKEVDKQFECHHCSMKFNLKWNLVTHMRVSVSCKKIRAGLSPSRKPKRIYTCYYCREKFTKRKDFVSHQKNYNPCKTVQFENECIKKDVAIVNLPISEETLTNGKEDVITDEVPNEV